MTDPPIIIFTSFSNRTDKLFVYTNTIRNWATFLPRIQPVLFTTFESGPVIDIARKYGWYIYPNPTVNEFGCPILKDMYLAAYELFNATFYGYANGDILFDMGLNDTLSKMNEHFNTIKVSLLFGTRMNYKLLPEANYTEKPLWTPYRIHQLVVENQTEYFKPDAFDYFFVTKHYPFSKMKPLVISRSGFDTYFSAITNTLKLTTIEGTGSVVALHQTDHDGNYAHSAKRNDSDTKYNRILLGKFNYGPGFAWNAKYASSRTKNGTIFFKCRKCNNKKNLL